MESVGTDPVGAESQACPGCGTAVRSGQRFCHSCGRELPAAVSFLPPPTPPSTPLTSPVASPVAAAVTEPVPVASAEEWPRVFDGHDDLVEYPDPREPFRLRVVFVLAVFGALAALLALIADVVDIRTSRPTSGIETGAWTLDDLGSNLGLAVFAGVASMVIGGLLACFGVRWGAGLAAGGGLAVLGWATLGIGLAEVPISTAQDVTRVSADTFTLRVTRDVGWWLIVAVGAIGLAVFLLSLRWAGTGGRRALNPVVAALTALAAVAVACGPLVPVGAASFADNFRVTGASPDLPEAFFAGRLVQVGLIALTGVVGMLIVRSWGLGFAAGGLGVAAVLWVTSLLEVGDGPVGIAVRNPGADDTIPHAVTTVGMVASLVLLLVAAAMAVFRLRPGTSG